MAQFERWSNGVWVMNLEGLGFVEAIVIDVRDLSIGSPF